MATTKSTSTVDVTLLNSEMTDTVFKLNNPKSDITLEEIRTVYGPMIGNSANVAVQANPVDSHLFDKSGKPFVFVSKAVITETMIRTTEVE